MIGLAGYKVGLCERGKRLLALALAISMCVVFFSFFS